MAAAGKSAVSLAGKVVPLLTKGANLAKAQQPHLERFWAIAKVELAPPVGEIPQVVSGLKQLANVNRLPNLTMKDIALNATVCFEIFLMYQIGRIVGKRSLVGFDIEGTSSFMAVKKV
ncbi:ATP synthase subunit g, mitochondrial-like [Ylistrum balloti]|uniref:ATP synthase subunit g, mitochondrial-like n=1 Tax=Ylistrum balloti TaxID=509963 RepID=UPI002905F1E3|nr:ATP synthase subunit g, mitochondrial-like [Ylistrum balloti]